MKIFTQLFVFVEGPDDERFINDIVKPKIIDKYDHIKILKYANRPNSEIYGIVNTIKKQQSSDYIFMCDMDARGDKKLCITQRKDKTNSRFNNILDTNKMVVVKEEIESWYLSGVTDSNFAKMKVRRYGNTDTLTKEKFERLIPKKYGSSINFMIEILKDFSFEHAISMNTSIKYFFDKYISVTK